MPIPTHLLERAHQLIKANQLQNAELVLDAVVRVDPQNVEAWMTYLRIHKNQNDLDWLKERVLKTKELNETEKADLVNYYQFLTQNLNSAKENAIWTNTFTYLEEATTPLEESPFGFELIDVFDYPSKVINFEPRTRPRRRAMYTPSAFEIANEAINETIKVISHDPLGKKIVERIQKIIIDLKQVQDNAAEIIKKPEEAYINFSKSPHFEKTIGISLLTFFMLGVRLGISGYFFGYVFLGLFVFGSIWWLVNFGTPHTTSLNNQSRVFLHEGKTTLPEIKEIEEEIKSDTENAKEMVE